MPKRFESYDAYALLGFKRNEQGIYAFDHIKEDEIKAAFKKQALATHTDKTGQDMDMGALKRAKDDLLDASKRKAVDKWITDNPQIGSHDPLFFALPDDNVLRPEPGSSQVAGDKPSTQLVPSDANHIDFVALFKSARISSAKLVDAAAENPDLAIKFLAQADLLEQCSTHKQYLLLLYAFQACTGDSKRLEDFSRHGVVKMLLSQLSNASHEGAFSGACAAYAKTASLSAFFKTYYDKIKTISLKVLLGMADLEGMGDLILKEKAAQLNFTQYLYLKKQAGQVNEKLVPEQLLRKAEAYARLESADKIDEEDIKILGTELIYMDIFTYSNAKLQYAFYRYLFSQPSIQPHDGNMSRFLSTLLLKIVFDTSNEHIQKEWLESLFDSSYTPHYTNDKRTFLFFLHICEKHKDKISEEIFLRFFSDIELRNALLNCNIGSNIELFNACLPLFERFLTLPAFRASAKEDIAIFFEHQDLMRLLEASPDFSDELADIHRSQEAHTLLQEWVDTKQAISREMLHTISKELGFQPLMLELTIDEADLDIKVWLLKRVFHARGLLYKTPVVKSYFKSVFDGEPQLLEGLVNYLVSLDSDDDFCIYQGYFDEFCQAQFTDDILAYYIHSTEDDKSPDAEDVKAFMTPYLNRLPPFLRCYFTGEILSRWHGSEKSDALQRFEALPQYQAYQQFSGYLANMANSGDAQGKLPNLSAQTIIQLLSTAGVSKSLLDRLERAKCFAAEPHKWLAVLTELEKLVMPANAKKKCEKLRLNIAQRIKNSVSLLKDTGNQTLADAIKIIEEHGQQIDRDLLDTLAAKWGEALSPTLEKYNLQVTLAQTRLFTGLLDAAVNEKIAVTDKGCQINSPEALLKSIKAWIGQHNLAYFISDDGRVAMTSFCSRILILPEDDRNQYAVLDSLAKNHQPKASLCHYLLQLSIDDRDEQAKQWARAALKSLFDKDTRPPLAKMVALISDQKDTNTAIIEHCLTELCPADEMDSMVEVMICAQASEESTPHCLDLPHKYRLFSWLIERADKKYLLTSILPRLFSNEAFVEYFIAHADTSSEQLVAILQVVRVDDESQCAILLKMIFEKRSSEDYCECLSEHLQALPVGDALQFIRTAHTERQQHKLLPPLIKLAPDTLKPALYQLLRQVMSTASGNSKLMVSNRALLYQVFLSDLAVEDSVATILEHQYTTGSLIEYLFLKIIPRDEVSSGARDAAMIKLIAHSVTPEQCNYLLKMADRFCSASIIPELLKLVWAQKPEVVTEYLAGHIEDERVLGDNSAWEDSRFRKIVSEACPQCFAPIFLHLSTVKYSGFAYHFLVKFIQSSSSFETKKVICEDFARKLTLPEHYLMIMHKLDAQAAYKTALVSAIYGVLLQRIQDQSDDMTLDFFDIKGMGGCDSSTLLTYRLGSYVGLLNSLGESDPGLKETLVGQFDNSLLSLSEMQPHLVVLNSESDFWERTTRDYLKADFLALDISTLDASILFKRYSSQNLIQLLVKHIIPTEQIIPTVCALLKGNQQTSAEQKEWLIHAVKQCLPLGFPKLLNAIYAQNPTLFYHIQVTDFLASDTSLDTLHRPQGINDIDFFQGLFKQLPENAEVSQASKVTALRNACFQSLTQQLGVSALSSDTAKAVLVTIIDPAIAMTPQQKKADYCQAYFNNNAYLTAIDSSITQKIKDEIGRHRANANDPIAQNKATALQTGLNRIQAAMVKAVADILQQSHEHDTCPTHAINQAVRAALMNEMTDLAKKPVMSIRRHSVAAFFKGLLGVLLSLPLLLTPIIFSSSYCRYFFHTQTHATLEATVDTLKQMPDDDNASRDQDVSL